MITFKSAGCVSMTMICSDYNDSIGKQVGSISWGIQPTYGMTADDMQVKTIVIKFTWSD